MSAKLAIHSRPGRSAEYTFLRSAPVSRADDQFEDYDDLPPDPRPPRQTRTIAATTVLLIVGGILLALVVLCGGAFALFRFNGQAPPPPVAATAVQTVPPGLPRVYDRAELRGLVLGSDPNALSRTLGRPNWIEQGPPQVWHYGAVARDPATGLIDADVAVVFGVGTDARTVKDVRFTSADVNGKGN